MGPQPGPQERFLATPADIAIYGGAAGGGKSYALLMEALRHVHRPGFGAVIFRRTFPEITNEGGLWDTSEKLYPAAGATPKNGREWFWPKTGVTVSFSHMQHEKDKLGWQGAAIPYIGFDELTHFSKGQFFYMVSRNRLTHDCGVKPYIRATCNPEADGWVASFISWWIDQSTGFPIPSRAGKIRWFIMVEDQITWGDSKEELRPFCTAPGQEPKSVTFIPSKVTDNPALLKQDPGYLANLHSLPRFERLQLLEGNWLVRPTAGMFFQRSWFRIVDAAPADLEKVVRYWDRAATEPTPRTNPDWTAGCKMGRSKDGLYYVLGMERFRARPHTVKQSIRNIADQDTSATHVWLEQDPGQAGVAEIGDLVRALDGFAVFANKVVTSKVTRALPASAQAEAGNIIVVRGAWNDLFFQELEAFCDEDELPDELKLNEPTKKDQVDAFSGAYNVLCAAGNPRIY